MVDAIVLAPCKEIIRRAQFLTSAENDASLRINKQQCKLLVKWLSETQTKLDKFHDALHEEAIRERISSFPDLGPPIEEFHRVLEGSETLIKSCCCNDQWLMAAIRQDDMKETFAKFLYDLQWCTSVLYSILLTLMRDDNSVNILGPAECKGNLGAFDYFDLSTAAKQDQEDLKVSLYHLKADHICGAQSCDQHLTEQCLAAKLVAKLDAEALQDDDSSDLSSSPLFLWLNEQHLPDGKRLGRGGFGEVRETRWFGGTSAKKTCHVHLKQSFNQELGALARLHHPHIVNLVCCCRDKTTFSLIMERMDKSLFEHLEEHREDNVTGAVPFSHLQAVNLMLQVAEGMKYIHNKKLVHRDLKSPNILINFSRDSYIAKVADFGLTKIKHASTAHQTLNVGSTKWMAPEVFNLAEDELLESWMVADAFILAEDEVRPARFHPMKMDVYSFGIVCWEVLTGEVPFEDEQNRSQLKRNVKVGMRPELPPDCPTSLADLIQRCWDGNPHLQPDFPEICTRLRYIKGRLLQGESKMELSEQQPFQLEGAKVQGPWGGTGGGPFFDGGTMSITHLYLEYTTSPGPCICCLAVEYTVNSSKKFTSDHGDRYPHLHHTAEIILESPLEYLTKIEGSVGNADVGGTIRTVITSLKFHTNSQKVYGPYGGVEGDINFTSDEGRVVGFFGKSGLVLDELGVILL